MAANETRGSDANRRSRDRDEELERATMSSRVEADQEADDMASDDDDTEEMVAQADEALTDMEAREMRRDNKHRTGGDDHNSGVDTKIDANAPKEDQLSS